MKLAILVAALVALCSIAAFAADTWKQEGDNWYCYDKDGNMVTGEWRKSGSNQYYLDYTGVMATNKLVDDGSGDLYYVGADGAKVIGQWQKVAVENNEDGDGWEYMYFKTVSGKAQKGETGKFYTINGNKYMFTSDGYMLYGYIDSTGTKVSNASEAAYQLASKNEGWALTGWVNVKDGADENYSESASIWFYFYKGVKKVAPAKIDGVKYYFLEDGKLVTGWQNATLIDASGSYYYLGGADDGKMHKSEWIKTDNQFNSATEDGDTSYWYYLKKDGTRQTATDTVNVYKINGKYYLFDKASHMISGLAVGSIVTGGDKNTATNFVYDATRTTYAKASADNFDALGVDEEIMFFSSDADTDGSLKVGSQTITIDSEERTVVFDKHGYALEGYVSKKIYKNGVLQAAGSSIVAVKELRKDYTTTITKGWYLVNGSGTIITKQMKTDADGIYWVVKGYKENYKLADTEYAAQAAKAILAATTAPTATTNNVTFTVKEDSISYTYTLKFTAVNDTAGNLKYYDVSWSK